MQSLFGKTTPGQLTRRVGQWRSHCKTKWLGSVPPSCSCTMALKVGIMALCCTIVFDINRSCSHSRRVGRRLHDWSTSWQAFRVRRRSHRVLAGHHPRAHHFRLFDCSPGRAPCHLPLPSHHNWARAGLLACSQLRRLCNCSRLFGLLCRPFVSVGNRGLNPTST